MEFGSEWAYLKHGEDIESVEEEESLIRRGYSSRPI